MEHKDAIRLKHMRDAAQEALTFAKGKTRSDLNDDRQLVLSIIKDVEIIGEAASKLSKEVRDNHPEIEWLDIIDMRNHLIHVYFDIDLNIVWKTLNGDLPKLIQKLEKIIPR